MDLINTLSFRNENTTDLEKKNKLASTLDYLHQLENASEDEIELEQKTSTIHINELRNIDFAAKTSIKVEASSSFNIGLSSVLSVSKACNYVMNSKVKEAYYTFNGEHLISIIHSKSAVIEQFRSATEWILNEILLCNLKEVYFYAANMNFLLFVSLREGSLYFVVPRTSLSLRKYISSFFKVFSYEKTIANDNSFTSSVDFTCSLDEAREILFNFSSLTQKDWCLQIYSPDPFIYATIIPNTISSLKKTKRITQKWNEETQQSEIVEFTTFSQCLKGYFLGQDCAFYLAQLLLDQNITGFKIEFEAAQWSLHFKSIKSMKHVDCCNFDVEFFP